MSTLERKHLTEPSPSDWERIEQLVIDGEHPYTAARKHGFTLSALRRANREWHAYLLELARDEDRQYVRAKLRQNVEDSMSALPARGDVANKALELLGKDAGMFTERVEVEHGGTIAISHADIAQAVERFTTAVVQLAQRNRAELAAGEPD